MFDILLGLLCLNLNCVPLQITITEIHLNGLVLRFALDPT